MFATQLLLASAIISGTPYVVDFPAAPSCPSCPTMSTVASSVTSMPCPGPGPVSTGMVSSCPVVTVSVPGFGCPPCDDCIYRRCLAKNYHTPGDLFPAVDLMETPCRGNYYFRPYNSCTVLRQQAEAQSWGADPRMPYAHGLFDRLYGQVQDERQYGSLPPFSPLVRPVASVEVPMPVLSVPAFVDDVKSGEPRSSDHFVPAR